MHLLHFDYRAVAKNSILHGVNLSEHVKERLSLSLELAPHKPVS